MSRMEPGEPYLRISVDEAVVMHGRADVVFIDVRRDDEYESGHVEGALSIQVDDILSRIDELPKDKNLLFICAQGARSGVACEMAAAMGFAPEKLHNVEDGTPVWIEKGHPAQYGVG